MKPNKMEVKWVGSVGLRVTVCLKINNATKKPTRYCRFLVGAKSNDLDILSSHRVLNIVIILVKVDKLYFGGFALTKLLYSNVGFLPFFPLFASSMASSLSLPRTFIHNSKSTRSRSLALLNPNILNIRDQEKKHGPAKPDFSQGFQFSSGRSTPRAAATKWMPPGALSSMESASESDQISCDDDSFVSIAHSHKMEFNRVNCLVWAMHESARGFSLAAQALDLARTGPELAMAWRGVDAQAWHKNIAYRVAVCGLLKAAIEVEIFLCRKQSSNLSPAHEILSPKAHLLAEQIERELNARNPKLVLWFRSVELPRIAGLFIPLFKKWSLEYAGSLQKLKIIYDKSKNFSGVAGKILALSCCTAIMKLESQRISHPLSFIFIEDASIKLMTLSEGLVSVNKLHHLASEAGFEEDFLSHFGRRILPSNNMEDLEFWIGLVQRKLSAAFQRESVITDKHKFHDKAQENSLAFLGLFAYLGRETRLYLSRMGIKDLDEHSKNFLSYLECGSLLIHPDLSTMSKYHLFMEVVTDEIGWLHFYPDINLECCQDRRRSKRHVRHAEKEIVLCKVLTACYDVISGFTHYSNSTQQAMNSNFLEFLFNSQNLLSTCMDDYWASFDKISTEPQKLIERSMSNSASSSRAEHMPKISTIRGMDPGCRRNQTVGSAEKNEVTMGERGCTSPVRPLNENFVVKASRKVISTSVNAWMGTQLLFIDALEVIGMVRKQLHGCGVTKREKKKIKRTLVDFASLVPVLILMLLPVSPVGHAAILAAIKKYLPCLIPSPYTSERIGLVKQLKRIKKIEFPRNSNIQDAPEVIDPFNT